MNKNTRKELEIKLEQLYSVTGIPVSIITEGEDFDLLFPQLKNAPLMEHYSEYIASLAKEHNLGIYTPLVTSLFSRVYYCIFKVTADTYIQLGPAASHNIDYVDYISKMNEINSSETVSHHIKLLRGAPKVDLNYFCNVVILATKLLFDKTVTKQDIILDSETTTDFKSLGRDFFNKSTLSTNELSLVDEIYLAVRDGNIERLDRLQNRNTLASFFYFQENDIYFLKIAFIFYGAIVCHYAKLGGLEGKTVKAHFNKYLKVSENFIEPTEFWDLLPQFARELCVMVSEHNNRNEMSEIFKNSTRYIKDNIFADVSTEAIINYVKVSERTLLRHFKKYSNMTLSEYILDVKLTEAAKLLRETNLEIIEISNLLNFSSQSHFTQRFHAKYNTTPLRYRMKQRK